jgi:hypothetical protein
MDESFRVAAQPKARIVFARSNAEIVGSNPTGGTDVYVRLFCVCLVQVAALRRADPPFRSLPTVYRIRKN